MSCQAARRSLLRDVDPMPRLPAHDLRHRRVAGAMAPLARTSAERLADCSGVKAILRLHGHPCRIAWLRNLQFVHFERGATIHCEAPPWARSGWPCALEHK